MFKILLIWRYFIKKRVALIAVLAVTLLVMMVLVVLSVMSGLTNDARMRNHRWAGDLVLRRDSLVGFPYYEEFIDRLRQSDIVEQATPVIKMYGLGESDWTTTLIGVRLQEFLKTTGFAECLYKTAPENITLTVPDIYDFDPNVPILTAEQKRRGLLFGSYSGGWPDEFVNATWQGARLKHYYSIPITIFALNNKGVLTGSEAGENQSFWFVNYFHTGLFDVDESLIVDFDVLQKLCWMDGQDGSPPRTSEIRIKLRPNVTLDFAQAEIISLWQNFLTTENSQLATTLLRDVTVQTWRQYRRDFIAPLESEKSLMIIIFSMIAMAAAFIIFAIFYMIVTEKIKDLGIIKSLGGSKWDLAQIFLGYGALVGIIGAVLGSALGCGIVLNSNEIEGWLNDNFGFRVFDPDLFPSSNLPNIVEYDQAALIAVAAVLTCLAGAALPARRAAKLVVVEALRVE